MASTQTTPTGATVEVVDFPDHLDPAKAVEGTVIMEWLDDEAKGKLYKIVSRHSDTEVRVVREDGKRFRMRIADAMLAPASRKFPVLPDYLPKVGDLVHVRGVRGVKATYVLFVGSVTRGKAKCYLLDNTHRSVSLPIANLTEVAEDAKITVSVEG